jgi:hypothetical protein
VLVIVDPKIYRASPPGSAALVRAARATGFVRSATFDEPDADISVWWRQPGVRQPG